MTYKPDMVRFQIVKDTVAEFRESESATLRLDDLISAANKSLSGGASSSSSSSSSSGIVLDTKPFNEKEMAGHLMALETDNNIMFVKRRGMVYLI